MKKIIIACLMAWSGICTNAQTEVTPFVPGSTVEGVCYYLPRTAFRITLIAEWTKVKPGEFHKYAFRYLRRQDVPEQEEITWRIKDIQIEPYGVPDKEKAYSIKVRSKTIAPLVGLSTDGILLSIHTEAEEEQLPALPQGTPARPLPNPRDYMTQEILSAGSVAKQAELCAQEIYDIRESRNALIRGEADNTPKDGEQLKLMLNQLDVQANALESMFCGTTQTGTEVFSMNYIPTEIKEKDVLFRFSQRMGMVDADNLVGEPVYIEMRNMETVPESVTDPQADKKKEKMEQGVRYNVPARIATRIYTVHKEWKKIETPMGQFGTVEILGNALFDKKNTCKVSFFQQTGGIKDIFQ